MKAEAQMVLAEAVSGAFSTIAKKYDLPLDSYDEFRTEIGKNLGILDKEGKDTREDKN